MRAPIALRVNPDVDAGTHRYVSTGRSENKFGIALDRVGRRLRAGRADAEHRDPRRADAHRLADHGRGAVRRGDRESHAADSGS